MYTIRTSMKVNSCVQQSGQYKFKKKFKVNMSGNISVSILMYFLVLQRLELETEISKVKLEKVDLDTHIRAKLASVESQMMSLELEKAQEKTQMQEQIVRFQ